MDESSKSRLHFTREERAVLHGRILDIGAGADPVHPGAVAYDLAHGDANRIRDFAPESFDCVYSSHCLEHMHDPVASLRNWWSLVRPGGHLFLIVPDEDLYEQGVFPSRFNSDHKSTFTIGKKQSWSPRSSNLFELIRDLPRASIVRLHLNDIGYRRDLQTHGRTKRTGPARMLTRLYRSLGQRGWLPQSTTVEVLYASTGGIDQTRGSALAQIEAIVRKES